MRRLFRRDLLVTSPPSPRPRKEREKKNPTAKCIELSNLLQGYADNMIVDFDVEILASEAGVQVNSARRWMYGYPPHRDLLWVIARHFATRMQKHERDIYNEIVKTLKDWRNQ